MSAKILNYILLLIICSLVIFLLNTHNQNQNPATKSSTISNNDFFLINFDKIDYERLKTLATRFKEGKGDNLMVIPPIIDGGHVIHDVMSDGREIRWTVDNTRDGMSSESDRVKTDYICKAIDIKATSTHYIFELSKCNNRDVTEKLPLVAFLKEKL